MSLLKALDIAEGLLTLDPVRTYPRRAAELIAKLVHAGAYRLELDDGQEAAAGALGARLVVSDPPPPDDPRTLSLPIRHGRHHLGTLHLHPHGPGVRFGHDELRLARWGARILARGVVYAHRLAGEGGRREGESVGEALDRAPLRPREREVAALVISGASTRDIAVRTGLTISTVNTYLKRIFHKLGVHSRVELVARMAGTDCLAGEPEPSDDGDEGRPSHIRRRVGLHGDVASTRPEDPEDVAHFGDGQK